MLEVNAQRVNDFTTDFLASVTKFVVSTNLTASEAMTILELCVRYAHSVEQEVAESCQYHHNLTN